MSKTLRAFIMQHSAEIRAHIKAACPNCGKLDMDDLADWVANDESLYNWALSEGAEV